MKKISVNIKGDNYTKKITNTKEIDIRPHTLNDLYIYENSRLKSTGKMPIALIVGTVNSYEDISKKIKNKNVSNWYWDDEIGLQLIKYPTRYVRILDISDDQYPLNRCFDFLWIKSGSIQQKNIAQSIVTIVAMHGKIALPHPEIFTKRYYEQFVTTKNLNDTTFDKYKNIIEDNGINFDCVFKDDDNSHCCLIQNNANSYNSFVTKINKNGYITTELFNVINYNLIHRNNSILENIGVKPVENWYLICDHIQDIINNQVCVQGSYLENISSWRFYLGYPRILTTINTNIIDSKKIDKKYVFTIQNEDNIIVDIK